MRRTRATILGCLLLTATLPLSAAPTTKRLPAKPGEKLDIVLGTGGSITVRGWEQDDVEVTADVTGKHADLVRLEIEREDGGVRIQTSRRDLPNRANVRVRLEVRVPNRFDVEFDTMGGAVDLGDIEGRLSGKTMGGELQLHGLTGEVDLTTMGGNVNVRESEIDGKITTMGGNVMMADIVGNLSAKTMGGDVTQHNVRPRPGASDAKVVEVTSMGGNLRITEAPVGASLTTMGGNITVESVGKFVEAETMGGNITVESLDGWAEIGTMGGNVNVRAVEGPTGERRDVKISSRGGDLTLRVPRGFSMDVEITLIYTKDSRRSFRIDSDVELDVSETRDWNYDGRGPSGEDIDDPFKVITGTGRIAGGAHKVRLSTVNGFVRLVED